MQNIYPYDTLLSQAEKIKKPTLTILCLFFFLQLNKAVKQLTIEGKLQLKTKLQTIYYLTEQDELGITYATSEKRITVAEAEDILLEREITFNEVLKVKYEVVEIEIPVHDLESYTIK